MIASVRIYRPGEAMCPLRVGKLRKRGLRGREPRQAGALFAEEVVGDALVEGGAAGAQERDGVGGALHVELLEGTLEGNDLPVDEQGGVAVVLGVIEGDLDDVAGIGDDGPGMKGMGGQGHGYHAGEARRDEGASSREGVGGRARGR